MKMTELISRVEFARRIHKSEKWVRKLIAAGKLPVDASGKLDWAEGFEAYAAAYPGEVDARPDVRPVAVEEPEDSDEPAPAPGGARVTRLSSMSAAEVNLAFNRSRARKEAAKARREENALAIEDGRLVFVDEVRAETHTLVASLRAAVLALPGKQALKCEGKRAAEIEAILGAAVNELLTEWHQGRFGQP